MEGATAFWIHWNTLTRCIRSLYCIPLYKKIDNSCKNLGIMAEGVENSAWLKRGQRDQKIQIYGQIYHP